MTKLDENSPEVQELKRIMKEYNITEVALMRGFDMYDKVIETINKFKDHDKYDPAVSIKMEQELVIMFAKSIDHNFYEGMLETAMRSLMEVSKIPQIKEIQKAAQAKVLQKLQESGNGDKVTDLLNKVLGNLGQAPASTSSEPKLDTSGFNPRLKKEDLN